MVKAYPFNERADKQRPLTDITELLEAYGDRELTREEKDKIALILYGVLGANSSSYRIHAWEWPMHEVLPRMLVRFSYSPSEFHIYFAPDKTSLRKALTDPILEIIQA